MQPVSGENGEIRQDTDADLFAHGLFDSGEVVAGEGNVGIFADLFGKPAGKTGVYGNLHETPVFAADGFQVAFMAVDAVGEMGDAAHGKVVLGGADEAQGDVGLAAMQVGECGITLNDKTYVVVFAVEIGNVGHQQESGDEWRCGNDDAVPQLGLFARGTLQHAYIFTDFAGMAVKPFAFWGEQVAFADAVEQAQAECVFQLGDLPRNGAVLHAQVFGSSGKGLFFHESGEVADAVPVPIHYCFLCVFFGCVCQFILFSFFYKRFKLHDMDFLRGAR